MNVIICLDDNNGMLFNNRRQSRDKNLIADVFDNLQGERLNITPFSSKLFAELESAVNVCDGLSVGQGQWFFCENVDLTCCEADIEKIIVYKWNRAYPCDFTCQLDFSKFMLVSESDFEGNSHPVITKLIYVKK